MIEPGAVYVLCAAVILLDLALLPYAAYLDALHGARWEWPHKPARKRKYHG